MWWNSEPGFQSSLFACRDGVSVAEGQNTLNFGNYLGLLTNKILTSNSNAIVGDTVSYDITITNNTDISFLSSLAIDLYDFNSLDYASLFVNSSPVEPFFVDEVNGVISWITNELAPQASQTFSVVFNAIQSSAGTINSAITGICFFGDCSNLTSDYLFSNVADTTIAIDPSPTPTEMPPSPSPEPSVELSPTPTPTNTPAPTDTPTPTPSPTLSPEPSVEPTVSPTPTESPSPTPTAEPSPTPTETPSPSPLPTEIPSPSPTPTPEPTATPTAEPTPTVEPTPISTEQPSPTPSETPTPSPTESISPTPTPSPIENPSSSPTESPNPSPIESPTPTPAPNVSSDNVDSTIILSNLETIPTEEHTIGGQVVTFGKSVTLIAGSTINLSSAALPNVNVSIPDNTTVLAPGTWDGIINPPATGLSSGTAPSGFSVGSTVIEVGSSDVVLLFDQPVSVVLIGVTGPVGYKPAGSNTWTQITNTCGGTYANPTSPTFPGECYISNGTDTKIYTYHFTSFASLVTVVSSTSSSTSSTSSGGGSSGGNSGGGDGRSDGLGNTSCNDTKPGSAPTLTSATTSGANQITLTWSKASNPVTYYLITYGTSSGSQQFGNPNIGGSGTTSFTVSGLSGGVTYYFKVRAGNGCTPGDYSNELSASTSGGAVSGPAAGFAQGILGASTNNENGKQSVSTEENGSQVQGESTGSPTPEQPQSIPQRIFGAIGGFFSTIGGFFSHLFGR